jgi:light-regulated signal transduction histidine kinase (bacteriophytochrome)
VGPVDHQQRAQLSGRHCPAEFIDGLLARLQQDGNGRLYRTHVQLAVSRHCLAIHQVTAGLVALVYGTSVTVRYQQGTGSTFQGSAQIPALHA